MRKKIMILGGVGTLLAIVLAATLSGRQVKEFSMHPLVQATSQSFALAAKTPYGTSAVTLVASGEQLASTSWSTEKIKQRLAETSLKNTMMPALPAVDARGRLIVGQELRDFFDYFASLQGEITPQDIDAMLQGYLQNELPASAAAEAETLLAQYKILQQKQQQLAAPSGTSVAELTQTFEQLGALRREVLGDAVAEAFFAEEEAYDRYSLEKMAHIREAVNTSDNLAMREPSNGVTAESLAESDALAQSLPAGLREREQTRIHEQQLLAETHRMEKSGASADDIYQYQSLHSDAEVAERYRALTEQRQHWDQRVSAYREQRDQIRQQSLADEQKNVLIHQLLAGSFSETEILRVQALEHMESR